MDSKKTHAIDLISESTISFDVTNKKNLFSNDRSILTHTKPKTLALNALNKYNF